jgi:hypothetical protein
MEERNKRKATDALIDMDLLPKSEVRCISPLSGDIEVSTVLKIGPLCRAIDIAKGHVQSQDAYPVQPSHYAPRCSCSSVFTHEKRIHPPSDASLARNYFAWIPFIPTLQTTLEGLLWLRWLASPRVRHFPKWQADTRL